ncbi:S1C family serine protease [Candidatus Latescibacterota bacterium]
MNQDKHYVDYSAFKTPKKRRIITTIYLILFGMFLGVMATNVLRPVPRPQEYENHENSVEAQTRAQQKMVNVSDFENVVIAATKKAIPAVVSVQTSGQRVVVYRFRDPFLDMWYGNRVREEPIAGMGSGVIIDPKGIIITNDHVINAGENAVITIKVELVDGRTYKAELIKHFPPQDIAILSIDGDDLPYVDIGSSSDVMQGQTVLAIGNPFGNILTGGLLGGEPTVTRGIISATRRNLDIQDEGLTRFYRNMLQTDASINEGNSGGALIDLNGRLIGINTAIYTGGGSGSIGIGFAIPSNRVKLILDSVNKYGDIGSPYTGIKVQNLTRSIAQAVNFDGVGGAVISSIKTYSPGEKSGCKPDDIIIRVNEFTMTDAEEVVSMFQGSVPGETFSLTVFREGKYIDLKITIGSVQ